VGVGIVLGEGVPAVPPSIGFFTGSVVSGLLGSPIFGLLCPDSLLYSCASRVFCLHESSLGNGCVLDRHLY